MAAGRYNILIEQGATFNLQLFLKDANGDPIDVAGWTGCGQIRRTHNDNSPVQEFTVTFPLPTTDGQVLIALTPSQTQGIAVDRQSNATGPQIYYYDIFLTRADGFVFRLIEGEAKVSPSITRC